MSGFLNRVQLIGNLGRDPEVRTTQSGGRVITLSIATSESWKDERSGERRERTEWHRVVIFNEGLGKIAERYPGERRESLPGRQADHAQSGRTSRARTATAPRSTSRRPTVC